MKKIFAGYGNPGCRFFSFIILNISCHLYLACRVSAERSTVNCIGFPLYIQFSSFQSLSHVQIFVTVWTATRQASLSITNSQSLFKLTFIELVSHPNISSSVVPFSSCLQSFPVIRVFSKESVLHIRWLKYWSFSFSISSSNEYSGLISFRID